MSQLTRQQLELQLSRYCDPYLGVNLTAKDLQSVSIDNGKVDVVIQRQFPVGFYQQRLVADLQGLLQALPGVTELTVAVKQDIACHAVQQGLKPLAGVKNIIAVASGKGGVGKSTTAVNLALALQAAGASTGILDADIYGPSQPTMLGGAQQQPQANNAGRMDPVLRHGLQTMSIGYLVDQQAPLVWRGPMVTRALHQLLQDTQWQDLDYLIVDLPPGTGDIQLSLAQKIPVSGAVIVTTPQDIALMDARRAIAMFQKVSIPVMGVVENMSQHICSQCGHKEAIFGEGGGQRMAEQYDVALLGQLPLDINIRRQADGGEPTVVHEPTSDISAIYGDIATKITAKLSLQGKDYSAKFPNIVIEN